MPLPEAYRQDKVLEGLFTPDYDALRHALPDRTPDGEDPEIVDLHELSDRFLSVAEAMPKVGRQGIFGFVYGTLTKTLARVVDKDPEVGHLPSIENPVVLVRQANFFAQEWLNPVHDLADWGIASQAGDVGRAREIAWHSDELWRHSFDAIPVQTASPPVQLIAGGLTNHIIKDLPPSLIRSGVTEAYMRPGGDYDSVSKHIQYVSKRLATEMMTGNGTVLRTGALSVAHVVGYMRGAARRTYDTLRTVETQEEYDQCIRDTSLLAARMNRMTVAQGEPIVRLFGKMAMIGQPPRA